MKASLVKTLGAGYGVATALGAALYVLSGGVVGPVLTVWIGGAVLTLALAAWRSSIGSARADPVDRLDDIAIDDRVLAARSRREIGALGA